MTNIKELKNMEGESTGAELTWIEEHFRDEGIAQCMAQSIAIGEARGKEQGRSEMLNVAIKFMRSSGMSKEQINSFRNSIKY